MKDLLLQLQKSLVAQGRLVPRGRDRFFIDDFGACIEGILANVPGRGHVALLDVQDNNEMQHAIKAALSPDGPFHFDYSHVAVQSANQMTPLTSAARPPGAFATVEVVGRPHGAFATLGLVYKSSAIGGDIAVSYKTESVPCSVQRGDFFAFYNDCNVTTAPITAGSRMIIVLDVIYDNPMQHRRTHPPRVASTLVTLRNTANAQSQKRTLYTFVTQAPNSSLDINALAPSDKLLWHRLAAANCFDIALVLGKKVQRSRKEVRRLEMQSMRSDIGAFGDDGDYDEDDDDDYDDDEDDDDGGMVTLLAKRVAAHVWHPSSKLPPVFDKALHDKPLYSPLNGEPFVDVQAPEVCIVFWLRQHRLRLLGFRASLMHLTALLAGTSQERYGFASTNAFAAAVLDMLDLDDDELFETPERRDVAHLLSVLVDLGDIDFVARVVRSLHVRQLDAPLQAALLKMLRRFGAAPFRSAIVSFLEKMPARLSPLARGAALVAGCLTVDQPHMSDLIAAAYRPLLQHMNYVAESRSYNEIAISLLQDMLRIEGYLSCTQTQAALRPCAVLELIVGRSALFDPTNVVAPAVRGLLHEPLALVPCRSFLNQPTSGDARMRPYVDTLRGLLP